MQLRYIGCALTTALILFVSGGSAAAHDGGSVWHKDKYLRAKVISLQGARAPGRDIVRYGIKDGKRATYAQIRRYFNTMRRMVMPRAATRYIKVGSPYVPPAHTASISAGGILQGIAACESGGNIRAIGGGGAFRGKYQFTYSTWASVGGSGDPAAASEAEQDQRAAILYARSGPGQWPVCGR